MVTVAKSFDAPIKLLFPKDLFDPLREPGKGLSMLGLGDIVLPGKYNEYSICIQYDVVASSSSPRNLDRILYQVSRSED